MRMGPSRGLTGHEGQEVFRMIDVQLQMWRKPHGRGDAASRRGHAVGIETVGTERWSDRGGEKRFWSLVSTCQASLPGAKATE